MFIIGLYLTGYCGRCGILVHTFEGPKFEESKKVVYVQLVKFSRNTVEQN